MLKLAKLTDYATVLATIMAAEPARRYSAQDLAERSMLSAATAAKLLKLLAQSGLVDSSRGAKGGYRLSRRPDTISVADVVDAIEGPIAITSCSIHSGDCNIETNCATRANWQLINSAIRHALEAVSLAQMAAPLNASPGREIPLQFVRSAPTEIRPRPE